MSVRKLQGNERLPEGFTRELPKHIRTISLDKLEGNTEWELVDDPKGVTGPYRRRRINHGRCEGCMTHPYGGEWLEVTMPVAITPFIKFNVQKGMKGRKELRRVPRQATTIVGGKRLCATCAEDAEGKARDIYKKCTPPGKSIQVITPKKRNTAKAEAVQSSL